MIFYAYRFRKLNKNYWSQKLNISVFLKNKKTPYMLHTPFLFETNAVGVVRNYFKTVAVAYVSIYASISSFWFFVACLFLIVAAFIIFSFFPDNTKCVLSAVALSCLLIK